MTSAPDALPALLPVGLGDKGGQFNQVYIDTFERIVLGGQDVRQVLDQQAEALRDADDRRPTPRAGCPTRRPRAPARSTKVPPGCPGLHRLRAATRAVPMLTPTEARDEHQGSALSAAAAGDALPARLLPLSVRADRLARLHRPGRASRSSRSRPWRRTGSSGTALLATRILLAAIVVPIQLVMALAMASIVAKLKTGRNTILYIFTIPLGLSDLAAGIIWLAIFEQSGFLNSMLVGLGVTERPILFLGYQNIWVIFVAVVLAEVWRATAIVMVILVSGMGLIPKEYYEAAEVFGAGPWKRFVKVTLPMLRPSLQTALILRTIAAFEVFAVVVALGGTTLPVLMGETFNWQFALQDRNVAAAYALVILAISIARDAGVPARAAHAEGGDAMTAATATAGDVPRARLRGRRGGPLPLHRRRRAALRLGAGADLLPRRQHAVVAGRGHRLSPRPACPSFDLGSLQFFVGFAGVAKALWNSVLVAVLTMILSIGDRRAGGLCAVALRVSAARTTFRLLVLMTRAFPLPLLALPLAVMFIRTGLDDTAIGLALVHTTLAHAVRGADHLLDLLGHSDRARGGGLDARLHPAAGVPEGRAAAGPAGHHRVGDLRLHHLAGTRCSPPRC